MSDYPSIVQTSLRMFDSLPVRTTGRETLDLDKVAAHIARARERGRYNGPTDPFEYLFNKQCLVAEGSEQLATPAGILCFGHHPQQIFSRAVVDIGHYRGATPLSFEVIHLEKDIGGTIFDQIERVEAYLWTNTHHGMTVNDNSIERVDIHEYPRVVIRELVVNMLAHRDYTNILSSARVQLFRDRIEWLSPGGLAPGVTVSNILIAQASRNPAILSILYEAGYVEAIGQGLDTVVTVLEREDMPPPHFEDEGSFFLVTVVGRPLDTFYSGDAYTRLTTRQRRILSIIRNRGEISSRDIAADLTEHTTQRSIQRDIKALLTLGLIRAIGESVAMRYRLQDDAPRRSRR
jgi:predicted HTH transcriptional regulator